MNFLRGGDRRLSNASEELKDVDMFVYTSPGGFFGRLVGRPLKFHVETFYYTVTGAQNTLKKVEVRADSLAPKSEIWPENKFDRLRLTFSEVERIMRRTRSNVLDTPRYPMITFDVAEETPDSVKGALSLRGESHMIQCTKTVEGTELVVRCPVSLKAFHVPPYKLWLGLFSVGDKVEIETRVPAKVFKL